MLLSKNARAQQQRPHSTLTDRSGSGALRRRTASKVELLDKWPSGAANVNHCPASTSWTRSLAPPSLCRQSSAARLQFTAVCLCFQALENPIEFFFIFILFKFLPSSMQYSIIYLIYIKLCSDECRKQGPIPRRSERHFCEIICTINVFLQ